MEILLRLCQQGFSRHNVSDYFDEFIDIYIKPQYDKSWIPHHRSKIRASTTLNELLFDNSKGLRLLYKQYFDKHSRFTLESARLLLAPVFEEADHLKNY